MKSTGLWGQMFLPKYFSQLLFCGEFQIMHTEQHGLYCSKISIYTVFLQFNNLELPFNGYSHA